MMAIARIAPSVVWLTNMPRSLMVDVDNGQRVLWPRSLEKLPHNRITIVSFTTSCKVYITPRFSRRRARVVTELC